MTCADGDKFSKSYNISADQFANVCHGHLSSMVSPGHSNKNTGGQITSSCRTLHLGRVWVDTSACRAFGLPSSAFIRADPQSDTLQALLASPWYMVPGVEGPLDMIPIPWCSRGALLWSLSVAQCWAPCVHKNMTNLERCETALVGFLLWDLWSLVGARMEAERDVRVGSMSMAAETVQNLQSIALGPDKKPGILHVLQNFQSFSRSPIEVS